MGGDGALIRRKQKMVMDKRMLKSKRKHLISSAIADNKRPQRSKSSGDLLLSLDDKRFTKLQQRGKTTPAGRFFFSQTQTSPDTYDIEGTVVQRGSTEYLLTNGKARVLRRLIGNSYDYSRLGKQYFQHKKTAYLVHVPAIIKKLSVNRKAESLWFLIMLLCSKS